MCNSKTTSTPSFPRPSHGRSLDDGLLGGNDPLCGGDHDDKRMPPLEIVFRQSSLADEDQNSFDISSAWGSAHFTLDDDCCGHAVSSEGCLSATSSLTMFPDCNHQTGASSRVGPGGEEHGKAVSRSPRRFRRVVAGRSSFRKRRPNRTRNDGLARWDSMPVKRESCTVRSSITENETEFNTLALTVCELSPRLPKRLGSFVDLAIDDSTTEEEKSSSAAIPAKRGSNVSMQLCRPFTAAPKRESIAMPKLPIRKLSSPSLGSESSSVSSASSTGNSGANFVWGSKQTQPRFCPS